MREIITFLLPIAAASGWFAAARHLKKRSVNDHDRLNYTYFQGLNYLLNERPDKALDIFVNLLEEGNETVETHLALGNLFRKRGEVERAIGIHERLLRRRALDQENRRKVNFELARDYFNAGLLDRAEVLFLQLVDGGSQHKPALEQLLRIYQQEKDWIKAIEFKRKLDQIDGIPRHEAIAQFFCELALESKSRGDYRKAFEFLEDALAESKYCVRASLINAEMYMNQGRFDQAISALKSVEKQDPAYLCEIIGPLMNCFEQLEVGDEQVSYLSHLYNQYEIPEITGKIAQLLENKEGDAKAIEFLFRSLDNKTTIEGINALITMLMSRSSGNDEKIFFKLRDFCTRLLAKQSCYRCEQCGFSGKQLHWRCPGCHEWETVKPIPLEIE